MRCGVPSEPVAAPRLPDARPLVVLGAGYAGLTVAHGVWRRSHGTIPTVLVDRHPVHVLRTELYEVGRLASAADARAWTLPLSKVFDRTSVTCRQASVESIDLVARVVRTDAGDVPYGSLAICLGNVAAYYGVPGAAENTHRVYRLSGAERLAHAIRAVEVASTELPAERRPRVVVIGGGSTGTELAAEIATTDWTAFTAPAARPPDVVLVTGALPFLAGLPPPLVRHAFTTLRDAGVAIIRGVNTVRVDAGKVHLEDGSVLACDLAVWCAGVEAPALVRDLPVPHGKGGRIAVTPTLEVPGYPEVYAVGDVAEFRDPTTGMIAPATAQAAIAEARAVAGNLVADRSGGVPRAFSYRERGVIVALGLGRAAASVRRVTLWGRPAAFLKRALEREYARTARRGEPSGLL
jgi:NADH:ubiquinone reductase (H+-translocating)